MDHFHYGALVMDKPVLEGDLQGGKWKAHIEVEIERGEQFGHVSSHIGEEHKTHKLNEDNQAWQALRFQLPPVAGNCFKELRDNLDQQYSAASKVRETCLTLI